MTKDFMECYPNCSTEDYASIQAMIDRATEDDYLRDYLLSFGCTEKALELSIGYFHCCMRPLNFENWQDMDNVEFFDEFRKIFDHVYNKMTAV